MSGYFVTRLRRLLQRRRIHYLAIFTVGVKSPLHQSLIIIKPLKYPYEAISSTTSKILGLHLWYHSEDLLRLILLIPECLW